MTNVKSIWTISDVHILRHSIPIYTLQGYPKISLVFLNLPDGDFGGFGFWRNNFQSLQKLLWGTIKEIKAIDGSNSFTTTSLQSTLLELIKEYRPDTLRTQDIDFVFWDHSDHRAVASLVKNAHMLYTAPHTFISYIDYMDLFYKPNIVGVDFDVKEQAFAAYAAYDSEIGCYRCFFNTYFYWLKRQYIRMTRRKTPG
jgi:LmbE family N-acetylglucosaminyl deacetylase